MPKTAVDCNAFFWTKCTRYICVFLCLLFFLQNWIS